MRVTSNYFSNSLVNQLNLLTARQYKLQNQAATGQRIQSPEDDPAAMQRTMELRAEASSLAQYTQNISVLQEHANASYDALTAVKKISDRAGEIATLADGTRSPEELKTYGAEVTQLIQQAVQSLNAKYGNQYLFSGTLSDQQPFTVTTDANGLVTGVTYQGNSTVADTQVETGFTIAVDVPGENNSGSGARGLIADSRFGADFFNHLISLQNNLLAGDTNAIANTDRGNLQNDENNLLYHISNNGAVQTRLDTAASLAGSRSLSVKKMVANESSADLTDTIMQLNQTQTAYQAALQSSANLFGMSLLNYLR